MFIMSGGQKLLDIPLVCIFLHEIYNNGFTHAKSSFCVQNGDYGRQGSNQLSYKQLQGALCHMSSLLSIPEDRQ